MNNVTTDLVLSLRVKCPQQASKIRKEHFTVLQLASGLVCQRCTISQDKAWLSGDLQGCRELCVCAGASAQSRGFGRGIGGAHLVLLCALGLPLQQSERGCPELGRLSAFPSPCHQAAGTRGPRALQIQLRRNCLNNEVYDQSTQGVWQSHVYLCSASLAYPALKKELRAIKESRKETCLFLTRKLCSDRLCCDQNQVAFVLPTVICAEIANSPPSPTCHRKSSDSFICPPGILLFWFSPAPSPEAQQRHARTGVG